jgi:hypothetical protein
MTGRGRGWRLSVVLWLAFAAVSVAGAIVLLRACGLLLPLAAALPELGWNFCPAIPPQLSADAERGAALWKQVRQLELELAHKSLACASIPPPPPPPLELPPYAGRLRPQQTALLKPPPPPPPPPKPPEPPKPPPAVPADRWEKKDLSLLEGCWRLGHDTIGGVGKPGDVENCTIPAGRICFDANGTGRREETTICAVKGTFLCVAPVTATFGGDGTLSTTQPSVICNPPSFSWPGGENSALTCRRVSDELVNCRTGDTPYEFRR